MRTRLLVGFALGTLTLGCQPEIGDACRVSTDCSRTEFRQCDLSNRPDGAQGECTIEGCGRGNCPEEAVCVQSYSLRFATVACDPNREDRASCIEGEQGDCVEVLPPLNDCEAHEVCLLEGICADEFTARTSCRRKCSSNKQCRAGYSCRLTGNHGVYWAPNSDDPSDISQVHICVPDAT